LPNLGTAFAASGVQLIQHAAGPRECDCGLWGRGHVGGRSARVAESKPRLRELNLGVGGSWGQPVGPDGVVEPNHERGMEDYRLDEVEAPARHPSAVRRLTGGRRSTVDYSGGELPGRRVDPRR
jgi:hypothetical protein